MNIFKIIIISLILLVSFLVVSIHPTMHKQVRIEKADFDVTQFSEEKAKQEESKKPTPFYKSRKAQHAAQSVQPEDQQLPPSQSSDQRGGLPFFPQNQTQQTPQQKAPAQPVQQAVPQKSQATLDREEIIAWNRWRSNLQNQTMRDSHLAAPVGTRFNFSFTVDKFGNISNLRIWAEPSIFTSLGVRAVRPVLMGYQGQSILNFPPMSKRVVVNVEGHFTMSDSSRYSSPSDYSDYERVK